MITRLKKMTANKVTYLITLISLSATVIRADDCKYESFDLSPLKGLPWETHTPNTDGKTETYYISVCQSLSDPLNKGGCKANTAVCHYGETQTSRGDFTSELNITETGESGELVWSLTGSDCAEVSGEKYRTIIYFKCGVTLGSPMVLPTDYKCTTEMEWFTTAVCKLSPTESPPMESRCYAYNKDGKKFDLSPLAMVKGGHKVDSMNAEEDFYINVCREIEPDGLTLLCPKGSAACRVTDEDTVTAMGQPGDAVIFTGGNTDLYLQYTESEIPDGCDQAPTTTITFKCPNRGASKAPLLLSSEDCHYEVEWVTEHACAEDYVTSTTCKLLQDKHDIDIDLTPLTLSGTEHYQVVEQDPYNNEHNYTYHLNVCGPVHMECPDSAHSQDIAACQTISDNSDEAYVLGNSNNAILRYADDELTLTYLGGAPCHGGGFHRMTVINFFCAQSDADDQSLPTLSSDKGCVYIFDWYTRHACPVNPPADQCRVTHNGHIRDLTSLIQLENENWLALDSSIVGDTFSDSNPKYFLNVCHDLVDSTATTSCPEGTAICKMYKDKYMSLGRYSKRPQYDVISHDITLLYTDGDSCDGDKKIDSLITFRCQPGGLQGAPVLLSISGDGCHYTFEWWTGAACVLKKKTGADCKVYDAEAGFSFDLNPLTRDADNPYKVPSSVSEHDYLVNVCAGMTGTPCNNGDNDVAICQMKKNDYNEAYSGGQPNGDLIYYDGLINLTYTGGDPYHGTPPVPRKTMIAFTCDIHAGKGKPEYLDESSQTYSFRWRTSYACPEAPVECAVIDYATGKQYDLSSLSHTMEGNWEARDQNAKFYLNVCRPVSPVIVPSGCDGMAAACATTFEGEKEVALHRNLGRARSPPRIEKDSLVLEYTDGDPCEMSNGTKTKYSTKIHLRCVKGQSDSTPVFLAGGGCEYSFTWHTEAACHLVTTEDTSNNCTVLDLDLGYTYNMMPLLKKQGSYGVTGENGKSYKVNVCGGTSDCSDDVAVCEDSGKSLGEANSASLKLSDGALSLSYEGERDSSGQREHVVIRFVCNQSVPLGEPVFKSYQDLTLTLEFSTSLACAPKAVDCVVTDTEGHTYDLSPLGRSDTDWRVMDTRPGHNDLTYLINVCRPLNSDKSRCPGGPIGACQLVGEGSTHNLGYLQSKPYAVKDGALSLQYLGGEICHAGTEKEALRSTRINFYCSETEHDPVFETESDECEYLITWRTPSACSQSRMVGHDCKVTEPLYHTTFDLSAMTDGDDWEVTSDGATYDVNVCGKLKMSGCGDNAGACYTDKDGKKHNAGVANSNLIYNKGELELVYTVADSACPGNRTTIIKLLCHHDVSSDNKDNLMTVSNDVECTHVMELNTHHACPPFKMGPCSIEDSAGNQYDLSDLSLSDNNYKYESETDKRLFLLNVCGTVVHTHEALKCPPNTAVCLIDKSKEDNTTYSNLGEPNQNQLSVDEGKLVLRYRDGQMCANDKPIETTILLECDEDNLDSSPTLLYKETCMFTFHWETSAACPINKHTSDTSDKGGDCTVTNPTTGYEFDLTSLRKQTGGYVFKDKNGDSYTLNVCGAVSDKDCGHDGAKDTGVCRSAARGDSEFLAGKSNHHLEYSHGTLVLNYTAGDKCVHNGFIANTIITFVCGADGSGDGEPVMQGETDDCTYYVAWHTELACEKKVVCEVEYKGETLDLSLLTSREGYHIATDSSDDENSQDKSYYINVCRPLNPIQGTLCPPEAAVCEVPQDGIPRSLGEVDKALSVDHDTGHVTLSYTNGAPCGGDKKQRAHTSIVFMCDHKESQGVPTLLTLSDDGCEFVFEWLTPVVCPSTPPLISKKNCTFVESRTGHHFDFSHLKRTGQDDESYKVSSYLLNVCGDVVGEDACKGSVVCSVQDGKAVSYGTPDTVSFVLESDYVKMLYNGGDKCDKGGTNTAMILFSCDPDIEGLGQPVLYYGDSCHVAFQWNTPLACLAPLEDCVFTHLGSTYDLSMLSLASQSWQAQDNNGNSFWLNLCRGVVNGPDGCPANAAVCRQGADDSVTALAAVETQIIHMDAAGENLLVKYSEGVPCEKEMTNSVTITLTCGQTISAPRLVSSEGCHTLFQWETSAACKQERIEMTAEDFILHDPQSGGVIDLTSIIDYSFHVGTQNADFDIKLSGLSSPDGCEGAAVCLTTSSGAHSNIGRIENKKFYSEASVISMEMTSRSPCEGDHSKMAGSTIRFRCDPKNSTTPTSPEFVHLLQSCQYVFDWSVSAACPSSRLSTDTDAAGNTGGVSGGGSSAAGIVITLVILLILVAVIAFIVYKPERRAACIGLIGRTWRRRNILKSYRYTVLRDTEGNDDVEVATMSNFHDDSDEDMLL